MRLRRRLIAPAGVAVLTAALVISAVRQAHAADTLLSPGRPALASSVENGATPAQAAVDGDAGTRWGSQWSDPQWLRIDLGASAVISRVEVQWETAFARAYQIQTSADGATWTTVASVTTGDGGTDALDVSGQGRYVRVYGTQRGTPYGYSVLELRVYGTSSVTQPPTGGAGYVPAVPPVTGVVPSTAYPPDTNPPTTHHEFQANCSVSRTNLQDDPIVFPGMAGASHLHTFLGNRTTNAGTTLASLQAGATTCTVPGDRSGYWQPTLYNGDQAVQPDGLQVIYYKSGVRDWRSVRPFPPGLRYLVGSPAATQAEFQNSPGAVEGWECGDSTFNWDFPANCVSGSQLNVRFQAPSCWDGRYLDTPDHKSHMTYPLLGVCPADHPVAVPMLEFKMAWPVSGNMTNLRFSSGRGFSYHYDFFNAWEPPILDALVRHCINGGLQCNPRGFDLYKPERGAALTEDGRLP